MIKKLAVIFDLDGTLVDTENIHAKAESILLKELGVKITPKEITRKYAGISTENYIEKITNYKKSLEELILRKNQIMDDLVYKKGIHPIPGMLGLVKYLNEFHIPMFIASSSSLEWIRRCLNSSFKVGNKRYSYGSYFGSNFVSCSEVKRPKPAPDVLLEVKKRIHTQYNLTEVSDEQFVVVGDSLVDMDSALNAKMKVLILGKFKNSLVKGENAIVFSSSEKLADYMKNLVQSINN